MGRYLHQYQWNFIHNPVPMIALFQDDEEGAYGETGPTFEIVNSDDFLFAPQSIDLKMRVKMSKGKFFKNKDVQIKAFIKAVNTNSNSNGILLMEELELKNGEEYFDLTWNGVFQDGSIVDATDFPLKLVIRTYSNDKERDLESGAIYARTLGIPIKEFLYPWYDRSPQVYIDPRHSHYLNYVNGTFDFEKFNRDNQILVDFRSKYKDGGETEISKHKEKVEFFHRKFWGEYMYKVGLDEVKELNSTARALLKKEFYDYWKQSSLGYGQQTLSFAKIRDARNERERVEFLEKLRKDSEAAALLRQKQIYAIRDMTLTGTSIALSLILFPVTGGTSAILLAGTGIVFSGSSLVASYNTFNDISKKVYDPNREYDILKSGFVSVLGDGSAIVYDLASLIVGTKLSGKNLKEINRQLMVLGKIKESEIEILLRAISIGIDSVIIRNQSIDLLKN